ncbi:hypothetical protein SB749_20670, partial [Brevibacterium sp. SIMBA_078]
GLHVIYEEIFHSGEDELKEMVLLHRLREFEWFSLRISEIFGEEIRNIGFEAAILFYGMMQHLSASCKVLNQQSTSIEEI